MGGGKDPHNRVGLAVKIDGAADDGRVSVEMPPPKTILQHHDLIRIAGLDAASIRHRNAQRGEEVFGGEAGENGSRFRTIVKVGEGLFILAGHVGEDTALTNVFVYGRGRRAVSAEAQGHDGRRVFHRGLGEQKLHRQRKDYCVRADAQGQGKYRGGNQRGIAAQASSPVNQVAPQIFEEREAPEVARLLLDVGCVPEGDRIAGGRRHVAMERQFGFEITFQVSAPKQLSEQFSHLASTFCTAFDRRVQVSSCPIKAFLPFRVIS